MTTDGESLSEYNARVSLSGTWTDKLDNLVGRRGGEENWLPPSVKEYLKEIDSKI